MFQLGPLRLAVPTRIAFAVSPVLHVARIPHRSGTVLLGLVAFRGEIVPCCSLARLLDVTQNETGAARMLLLQESPGRLWAVPIDSVLGIRALPIRFRSKPPRSRLTGSAAALTMTPASSTCWTTTTFSARSPWQRPECMSSGLEDSSLFDLFRMEAEEQVCVLQTGLIELEKGAPSAATLEGLMRASHSLKGAARIVGLDRVVHLTHGMEDRFVAAQGGRALDSADVDRMLAATDWLSQLQGVPEDNVALWLDANGAAIDACAAGFQDRLPGAGQRPRPQISQPGRQLTKRKRWHRRLKSRPKPHRSRPDRQPRIERTAAPVEKPDDAKSDSDIFSLQSREERAARERTVRLTSNRFDNMLSLSAETWCPRGNSPVGALCSTAIIAPSARPCRCWRRPRNRPRRARQSAANWSARSRFWLRRLPISPGLPGQ